MDFGRLTGGLLAAAIGAIAGTALTLTRTEEDRLSGVGEAAREKIGAQKDQFVATAKRRTSCWSASSREVSPRTRPGARSKLNRIRAQHPC